ncbi:hypothetical protein G9A89_007681 [Geosiphon pyriformis]|nr:hypothetical protein G9A89_007681 [Geosiphon pyriformis]
MLKELMAKIEANTDCRDFNVVIRFKEAAKMAREEAEFSSDCDFPDEKELIVNLFPKYKTHRWYIPSNKPVKNNKPLGAIEVDRIALKLRDPEEYAKIWGKKDRSQELDRLRKDVAAKEQEVAALRASAEVKESIGRISPLWLIPTVFVTMAVTALILVFVLKKKVYSNVK